MIKSSRIGFYAFSIFLISMSSCKKEDISTFDETTKNFSKTSVHFKESNALSQGMELDATNVEKVSKNIAPSSSTSTCTVQPICEFQTDMDYVSGGNLAAQKLLIGCPNNVNGCVPDFIAAAPYEAPKLVQIDINSNPNYYGFGKLYSKDLGLLDPPPIMTKDELNCYMGDLLTIVNNVKFLEYGSSSSNYTFSKIEIVGRTRTNVTSGTITYYHALFITFQKFGGYICA